MIVLTYPPILTSISVVHLRKEVEYFSEYKKNHWLGIHDAPENTVEKYIQDSFDFCLKENYNLSGIPIGAPVGFEWWIEYFDNNNSIPFHSSNDEHLRITENKLNYPFCTSTTYLTNHTSPTIILNTRNGKCLDHLLEFPPTEVIFSVPEEGKFVTYDSRYIRGVHPNDNQGRVSLCYDVWHYRPKGLERIGLVSKPFACQFYKTPETQPLAWLGKIKDCTSNLYDKVFTFKYPTTYREGETWKVIQ